MGKGRELMGSSDPYTSASYFRENLRLLDVLSGREEVRRRETPHFHDEIEMLLVTGGEGTLVVNGVDFPLQPGTLCWLMPFHVHALQPRKGEPLHTIWCRYALGVLLYVNVNQASTPLSLSVLEYAPPCLPLGGEVEKQVRFLFDDILRESAGRQPGHEMFLLSSLMRLVALYERTALGAIQQNQRAARTIAWEIFQHLQFAYNKELDSASLGAHFGLSASELNGALRLLTGRNFSQNLHDVRIRNARAMMQFEELSIPYIARAVGYTSPATFYRQFKALCGQTPDEYRKAGRQGRGAAFSDSSFMLLHYLNENYREPLTPAAVAAALYMSENALATVVEANFGCTFTQLLQRVRLWVAAGLLLGTSRPIVDIAVLVGFGSSRTFARGFGEEFGTSPSAFRQSAQREGRGYVFGQRAELPVE